MYWAILIHNVADCSMQSLITVTDLVVYRSSVHAMALSTRHNIKLMEDFNFDTFCERFHVKCTANNVHIFKKARNSSNKCYFHVGDDNSELSCNDNTNIEIENAGYKMVALAALTCFINGHALRKKQLGILEEILDNLKVPNNVIIKCSKVERYSQSNDYYANLLAEAENDFRQLFPTTKMFTDMNQNEKHQNHAKVWWWRLRNSLMERLLLPSDPTIDGLLGYLITTRKWNGSLTYMDYVNYLDNDGKHETVVVLNRLDSHVRRLAHDHEELKARQLELETRQEELKARLNDHETLMRLLETKEKCDRAYWYKLTVNCSLESLQPGTLVGVNKNGVDAPKANSWYYGIIPLYSDALGQLPLGNSDRFVKVALVGRVPFLFTRDIEKQIFERYKQDPEINYRVYYCMIDQCVKVTDDEELPKTPFRSIGITELYQTAFSNEGVPLYTCRERTESCRGISVLVAPQIEGETRRRHVNCQKTFIILMVVSFFVSILCVIWILRWESSIEYPDANYVERHEALEQIHSHFIKHRGSTQVICGIAGIGKTQLALRYIQKYRKEYKDLFRRPKNVLIIDVSKSSSMTFAKNNSTVDGNKKAKKKNKPNSEFEKFFKSLTSSVLLLDYPISDPKVVSKYFKKVSRTVGNLWNILRDVTRPALVPSYYRNLNNRYLIVLENARDYISLEKRYLRRDREPHDILITSRDCHSWVGHNIQVTELKEFNAIEICLFLRKFIPMSFLNVVNEDSCKMFSLERINIPLMLYHAANYIVTNGADIPEFFRSLKNITKSISATTLVTTYPSIMMSLKALPDDKHRRVLAICSLLDTTEIPMSLIQDESDKVSFHKIIAKLESSHFLKRKSTSSGLWTFSMHLIVQLAVKAHEESNMHIHFLDLLARFEHILHGKETSMPLVIQPEHMLYVKHIREVQGSSAYLNDENGLDVNQAKLNFVKILIWKSHALVLAGYDSEAFDDLQKARSLLWTLKDRTDFLHVDISNRIAAIATPNISVETLKASYLMLEDLATEEHTSVMYNLTKARTLKLTALLALNDDALSNFQACLQWLKEAISLFKSDTSSSFVDIAESNLYLGMLYIRNNNDTDAAKHLEEAKIIYNKDVRCRSCTANVLCFEAQVHYDRGNFSIAAATWKIAINIYNYEFRHIDTQFDIRASGWSSIYKGSPHPRVAEILYQLGDTFCQLMDHSNSVLYFQGALAMIQYFDNVALDVDVLEIAHRIGFATMRQNVTEGVKYFKDMVSDLQFTYDLQQSTGTAKDIVATTEFCVLALNISRIKCTSPEFNDYVTADELCNRMAFLAKTSSLPTPNCDALKLLIGRCD